MSTRLWPHWGSAGSWRELGGPAFPPQRSATRSQIASPEGQEAGRWPAVSLVFPSRGASDDGPSACLFFTAIV